MTMIENLEQFNAIAQSCQNSPIGKLLPSALYVHQQALEFLDPLLQEYEQAARKAMPEGENATLVKFSTDKPKISYLFYPDFDADPHPALHTSIVMDMQTLSSNVWDYSSADNPPILHRKENIQSVFLVGISPDPMRRSFPHWIRSALFFWQW